MRDQGNCEGQGEYLWIRPGEETEEVYGYGWDSDYYLDNNKSLLNHAGVIKGPNQETKQGAYNYACDDHHAGSLASTIATDCWRDVWWLP